MPATNIAIFASGRGSNAKAILEKEDAYNYKVQLLVVSKKDAPVLDLAHQFKIAFIVLDKQSFLESTQLLEDLEKHAIDLICLAGFLWKIPNYLVKAYSNKIVNIHPSLLPKYGGKGMYGKHVHEAVITNQEEFSGITIHLVNEEYDKGEVLFQEKIRIHKNENVKSLAERVLSLEHEHFPKVIGSLCSS